MIMVRRGVGVGIGLRGIFDGQILKNLGLISSDERRNRRVLKIWWKIVGRMLYVLNYSA